MSDLFAFTDLGDVSSLGNWNVSGVTNLVSLFAFSSFNGDIATWDVSSVNDMTAMFTGASFNQDISSWDVSNVETMVAMFDESRFSDENYDKLLIGWSQLPQLQENVVLGARKNQYCEAKEARQLIIDTYGWTINDAGEAEDCQRPFITTWTTFSPEVSEDNQDNTILIPTFPGETYDYSVDWGDGTMSENVTGDITHTYDAPGTYTVSISGVFPRFYYNFRSGSEKILSVDQWGDIQWTSMERAFMGCYKMDMLAIDAPDLSSTTSLAYMFQDCVGLSDNDSYNLWDVSTVTDLSGVFVMSSFNSSIVDWDVGQVTNMFSLFSKCPFNQDIGDWDTSKVENMSYMFELDTSFNYDIGGWDTSSVINMFKMFDSATSFNQNLGQWNVSNVSDMRDMFGNSDFSNGLSNENYEKILIGWSQLTSLQNNVILDAPQNQYCEAKEARQSIIDDYGWTINDAGLADDCQRPFVTTWKTDNPGASEDNQIIIPTFPGETYNYTVHWGDGTISENVTGDITHTYEIPGTYTVSILGEFPSIFFANRFDNRATDDDKILSIDSWGTLVWRYMTDAFSGCDNLDIKATDKPDLSQVNRLNYTFAGCTSLVGNISMAN